MKRSLSQVCNRSSVFFFGFEKRISMESIVFIIRITRFCISNNLCT